MHIICKACFRIQLWNHHLSHLKNPFIMKNLKQVQRKLVWCPHVHITQITNYQHTAHLVSPKLCTANPRHLIILCIQYSHLIFLLIYYKNITKRILMKFSFKVWRINTMLAVTLSLLLSLLTSAFEISAADHGVMKWPGWADLFMSLGNCELNIRGSCLRRQGKLSTDFR